MGSGGHPSRTPPLRPSRAAKRADSGHFRSDSDVRRPVHVSPCCVLCNTSKCPSGADGRIRTDTNCVEDSDATVDTTPAGTRTNRRARRSSVGDSLHTQRRTCQLLPTAPCQNRYRSSWRRSSPCHPERDRGQGVDDHRSRSLHRTAFRAKQQTFASDLHATPWPWPCTSRDWPRNGTVGMPVGNHDSRTVAWGDRSVGRSSLRASRHHTFRRSRGGGRIRTFGHRDYEPRAIRSSPGVTDGTRTRTSGATSHRAANYTTATMKPSL